MEKDVVKGAFTGISLLSSAFLQSGGRWVNRWMLWSLGAWAPQLLHPIRSTEVGEKNRNAKGPVILLETVSVIFIASLRYNLHTYNKLHLYKMYSLSFDICTHLWNHLHNQDNEHIYHPQKNPLPLIIAASNFYPFHLQTTTDL